MSLYQKWIAPETVAEVANKLTARDPDGVGEQLDLGEHFTPKPGEIRDLRKLFRICGDRSLGIIVWFWKASRAKWSVGPVTTRPAVRYPMAVL